ncbi:MAG: glycosyltransferase family 2 protein [Spirochaetaceae bacterium]|nr:glycosyltransferase family 2 protein [Spirochaetaceae bacterium]
MTISIIVPCYNEEEVINMTNTRLASVLDKMDLQSEIIYINDGSSDKTSSILSTFADEDSRIRVLSFSRNFGHQAAVSAGLQYCKGDAAIIIDADLQDPPELFPEMIRLWREGNEVVYGQRLSRKGESGFKKWSAKMFYRTINRLSDIKLPLDTGDFRLVDRIVIDAFNNLPERDKYIRGLFAWLGFRQTPISYNRDERAAGETKYPLKKMIKFASNGIIAFSRKPLEIALQMGIVTLLISLGLTVYTFISYFLRPMTIVPGWASTLLVILFLGSVQLLSTGVLGKYIGRIYDETKGRPEYIISHDSDSSSSK